MDARRMVDAAMNWTTVPLKVTCTIPRLGVNRYAGIKLLCPMTRSHKVHSFYYHRAKIKAVSLILWQITVAVTFQLPFIVFIGIAIAIVHDMQ